VGPAELKAFDQAAEQRYRKFKSRGKLIRKTPQQLRKITIKSGSS
jgi:hypothetical protein